MARFFGRNFATGLLIGCVVAIGVAAAAITYERYDTKTLKRTMKRDAVHCGVNTGLPGFSANDGKGNWSGFDVDFCRAIAAAIFDDPKKVKFIPLDAKERFDELGKRKVDVLARNSTWTMSRETEYLCVPKIRFCNIGGEGHRESGVT
jgi:general L-amino acid transport system substrate-binding protein